MLPKNFGFRFIWTEIFRFRFRPKSNFISAEISVSVAHYPEYIRKIIYDTKLFFTSLKSNGTLILSIIITKGYSEFDETKGCVKLVTRKFECPYVKREMNKFCSFLFWDNGIQIFCPPTSRNILSHQLEDQL